MPTVKKPSNHKPTDYIMSTPPHRTIWRSALDRNIFISFSLQQLQQTYGNDPYVKGMFANFKIVDFPNATVTALQRLTEQEFITRAKAPIKFLPADAQNMGKLNVCFVVSRMVDDHDKESNQILTTTLHLRKGEQLGDTDNTIPADYKLIIIPRIPGMPLTNADLYHYLHEMGHAAFAFKHTRPYNPQLDQQPFTDRLTCKDTVMSYEEDCPQVQKAEVEIFGEQVVSIFTTDPREQDKIVVYQNSYPSTLGPVDLAAIKIFTARQQHFTTTASNAKQNGKEKQKGDYQPKVDLFSIKTWLGNLTDATGGYIYRVMDYALETLIANITAEAQDLASSCPSYFPKEHPRYWQGVTGTSSLSNNSTTNYEAPLALQNSSLRLGC